MERTRRISGNLWGMVDTGVGALTQDQRDIVERCLHAAVEGPFFPDWEFHTLMGLHWRRVLEPRAGAQ